KQFRPKFVVARLQVPQGLRTETQQESSQRVPMREIVQTQQRWDQTVVDQALSVLDPTQTRHDGKHVSQKQVGGMIAPVIVVGPTNQNLQEATNLQTPASFGSLARLRLPGLSSRRPVSGSRVFHRGGCGADRANSVPDPQRSGPTAAAAERFPPSGHVENFLAGFRSGVLAEPAGGPPQ